MKSILCKSITEACAGLEAAGFELWKRRGLYQADNHSPSGEEVFYSKTSCTAEIFRKKGTPNSYITLFYDDPHRYEETISRYGKGSDGKLYVIGIHFYRGKNCQIEGLPGTLLCNSRVRLQLTKASWRNGERNRIGKAPLWSWGWSRNSLFSKTTAGNEISMRRVESQTPIFNRI